MTGTKEGIRFGEISRTTYNSHCTGFGKKKD